METDEVKQIRQTYFKTTFINTEDYEKLEG